MKTSRLISPFIISVLLAGVIAATSPAARNDKDTSCVRCHTDAGRLVELTKAKSQAEEITTCGADPGEG